MARKNDTTAFPVDGGPESGQWSEGMSLADYFATHAHIDDVNLAEADLIEDMTAAGIFEIDPLTLRIKARYMVADKMLQVRGEQ